MAVFKGYPTWLKNVCVPAVFSTTEILVSQNRSMLKPGMQPTNLLSINSKRQSFKDYKLSLFKILFNTKKDILYKIANLTRGSLAKKKIMFLHSKNKASRKGYKGEC